MELGLKDLWHDIGRRRYRFRQFTGWVFVIGLVISASPSQPGLFWEGAGLGVLFWLLYIPAIKREDDKLRRRFGKAWERWAAKTPAIVPTRWPSSNPGLHLSDWSLWQAVRNGEPVWTLCVTAAFFSFSSRSRD